jgi:hypothetical protein
VAVAGQDESIDREVSGGDRPADREPGGDGPDRLERDVRDGESGGGELGGARVEQASLEHDAVCAPILPGDLDRDRVDIDRDHRCEAKPCRGDREHAGAAADVEDGAASLGE